MYVLNLAEDNRILSIWDVIEGQNYTGMPIVEKRPEDLVPADATEEEKDAYNYLYVNGEYVYDPIPKEDPVDPETTEYVSYDEMAAAIKEGVNSYNG